METFIVKKGTTLSETYVDYETNVSNFSFKAELLDIHEHPVFTWEYPNGITFFPNSNSKIKIERIIELNIEQGTYLLRLWQTNETFKDYDDLFYIQVP